MSSTFVRSFRSALLLSVLATAAGCVFTVTTDPNAYPAAGDAFPALPAGTTVELVNSFEKSYLAKMTGNQQADLREFTETALAVLGGALEKKGAVVGAGGRRIVVEVTSPTWSQGFGVVRASVTLNAQLGETSVSAWGEAAGLDASRNFSAAISHAVDDLMRKSEMHDYLAKS